MYIFTTDLGESKDPHVFFTFLALITFKERAIWFLVKSETCSYMLYCTMCVFLYWNFLSHIDSI